jgi:hypothetical protein
VWCPGIGRGATKGFGDAPDEAYRVFAARLADLVNGAAPCDIERWLDNLASDQAERLREAHIRSLAARERMGEYSISLDPFHSAALRGVSGDATMNAKIVDALRSGVIRLREEARDKTEMAMRELVAANETKLRDGRRARGEDLEVRTVRMDADLHARLQLSAHELGVKLPELCRYAMALYLRQAAQGCASQLHEDAPEAFVSSTATMRDPLAELEPADFRAVAKRLGIPRELLASIRDRQVEVPRPLMRKLGESLAVPVPIEVMHGSLAGPPRIAVGTMFKSGGKPAASERRISFAEAASKAGMTAEDIERLLTD